MAEIRTDEQPPARQPEPAPETQPEPQPLLEGLPDVVTTSEEDAGPVETPEAAAKPARSRAPRAPRGERSEKPAAPRAPRTRRKAPEGEARAEDTPAVSEE